MLYTMFIICSILTFVGTTIALFKGEEAKEWYEDTYSNMVKAELYWILHLKRTKEASLFGFIASFTLYVNMLILFSIVVGALIGFTSPVSIPFLLICYIIWKKKNKTNS